MLFLRQHILYTIVNRFLYFVPHVGEPIIHLEYHHRFSTAKMTLFMCLYDNVPLHRLRNSDIASPPSTSRYNTPLFVNVKSFFLVGIHCIDYLFYQLSFLGLVHLIDQTASAFVLQQHSTAFRLSASASSCPAYVQLCSPIVQF